MQYTVVGDGTSDFDAEYFFEMDWPGEVYWLDVGHFEVVRDPTFSLLSCVLCDGEETPYYPTSREVSMTLDRVTEIYWDEYEDDRD